MIVIVSRDRLKVKVAYHITLAVGQKVHSITVFCIPTTQHTSPSIPFCNLITEWSPPSGEHTRSDVCVHNMRINWEHPFPLLAADMIIKDGGFGWWGNIVVHNIE